jgi:hypothetical protein
MLGSYIQVSMTQSYPHISTELTKLLEQSKNKQGGSNGRLRFSHQEWMFQPARNLDETKTANGHSYNWCAKCNMAKANGCKHTPQRHTLTIFIRHAVTLAITHDPLVF